VTRTRGPNALWPVSGRPVQPVDFAWVGGFPHRTTKGMACEGYERCWP
jgi:hypothetical protein